MKILGIKFIYFLLPAILLAVPHIIFSQDLDKKISIKIKNRPLGEAISQIGNLADINFSFSSQSIPVEKTVSIKAHNKAVKEIFAELFTPAGIDWTVMENQVVLRPHKGEVNENSGNKPPAVIKYTISGYLKDKANGEVLIGAYAYVKGTSLGTSTNAYGYYSLTLPEGTYDLAFSFVGYKSSSQLIDLKTNIRLSGDMEMAKTEITPVEIIASDKEQQGKESQLSQIKLTPRVLAQLPGFAGNVDIIRSLQAVPGIKSYGDGSALFYVRGGNSDQNLILVDEAPIYNPSHLFGFVSALAPDAIKDAEAYKGDFPANYGGRLSSVIDVRTKDGNMKKFGFGGNIGPFASDLSLEGPFKKEKCSFFVSGRRSNLNWLTGRKSNRTFTIDFFDVNARINLKLNDNNRFFVSVYGGNDDYSRLTTGSVRTFGISWNNILGTFRWNHIFNNKLFSNTTAYYSRYNYYMYISREQNDYWNSSISNLTFKTDLSWFPDPQNTVRAGIDISSHASDPGNIYFSDQDVQKRVPKIGKYHSMEYTLYVCNEQHFGGRFTLRYGIRLPVWQDLGATTYYLFNTNHQVFDTVNVADNKVYATFFNPEPRVSITYAISELSFVKASYNRTSQQLQLLSNSVSPFTSLEVWVPAGPNIKPQLADQYAFGWYTRLLRSKIIFSAEGFYKYFYNQIDYEDHANMLYNPLIEGELRFGKAYAYGLELMLRKPEGRLTGWIGYTWSRAFKLIEGLNNNEIYPASFDRPHDVCANISYDTRKRWAFGANWVYLSGAAITTPVSFYYFNGYSVPVYGSKNNDRLPAYHRLDIAITFRLSKPERKFQHKLILTVYNAYGRKNPISVNFNKVIDDNGNFVVPADMSGVNEIVPTSISVAGIIPSLNYSFKF